MRKAAILTIFVAVLMGFSCANALAVEPSDGLKQITLREAIKIAAKNSDKVKIQKEVADRAWDQRERAADNVTFIPTGGYAPQAEAAYSGLLQADLNYHIQRKEIEDQTDQVVLGVYQKYLQIKNLEKKHTALSKALEEMEWNKNIARVQLSVGLMAAPTMIGVDAGLQQAQSGLASVQDELNKAHVELNNYLGLDPEEKVALTDPIPYEPLVVDDLNWDTEKAVSNSIDVWQALQAVTIERKDLSFLSKDYKVEGHDVEIAEMNVAQAKDELRKQVRLLYHDINTLEESVKAAEQGIQSAQESLRVKKIEHEIGLAGKGEVISAEKTFAEAEKGLAELRYNHAVAVANYRNLVGRSIMPNENA